MTDPDLKLIHRTREGDVEAFGEIVVKYQPTITSMLHRFAASHADLEDLVQESFIKAWKALPDWQPLQPFSHWLKRIAVRTGLEYCRRSKSSPITPMESLPEIAHESSGEDATGASLDEARRLLTRLPADDQALLTLIHLNGMTMAEAADHFGWSMAKTKIKAFRARHLLRKILKQHGYDE